MLYLFSPSKSIPFLFEAFPLGFFYMNSKNYDISREGDSIVIRAHGKTRAGLFTAATHALFDVMQPNHRSDEPERHQHDFSFEAKTPEILLSNLLNEGIRVSNTHLETCEELKLDLITDKQVNGHFVGCGVTHFDKPIVSTDHEKIVISKNAETGEWETTIHLHA